MVPEVSVDLVAVLVASIVGYVVGFVWHMALGKQWAKLSGITPAKMKEMKKNMTATAYVGQFVLTVVMAFVLANMLAFAQAETSLEATMGAFWLWLGFVATVLAADVLWKKEPLGLFGINAGFYLVMLVVMANVILMTPPLF